MPHSTPNPGRRFLPLPLTGILAGLALLAAISRASADENTLTTGDWSNSSIWSASFVPDNNTAVTISSPDTATINGTTQAQAEYVTIDSGATLIVSNGGSLTTNDGVASPSPNDSGTYGIVISGTFDLQAGGTIQVATGNSLLGTGGGVLSIGDGDAIGAPLNLSGNATSSNLFAIEAASGTAEFTGVIADADPSGPASLAKQGSGTLVLDATNTYTGGTTVSAGVLQIDTGSSLGTGTVTVSSGATLAFGAYFGINNDMTISGSGTSGQGAIQNANGDSSEYLGGTITLAADATVAAVTNNDTLQFQGPIHLGAYTLTAGNGVSFTNDISGTGGLTIASSAYVFFSGGSNSFSGMTTVDSSATLNLSDGSGTAIPGDLTIESGGTVQDNRGGQLATTTVVTLNGGEFEFNPQSSALSETVAGLQGTSSGSLIGVSGSYYSPHTANSLILDGMGTYSYAGQITDSPTYHATLGLTMNGTGSQTLSGNNTYTGGTTIEQGTLLVGSSSALGTGDVTVSGGTLAATTGGPITLNVGGGYTQTGGTLQINAYSATSSDKIAVTGAASLGGNLVMNFSGYTNATGNLSYTILTATGGITGAFADDANVQTVDASPTLKAVATIDTVNNEVVVNTSLSQLPFATLAGANLTGNQSSIAQYIDSHDLNNPNAGLTKLVGALNTVDANPSSLGPALDQLTPAKFTNFHSSTAFNNTGFMVGQFDNYLINQRGGDGTFASSGGSIDTSGLSVNGPGIDAGLQSIYSHLLAWNPPLGNGIISDTPSLQLGGVDEKANVTEVSRPRDAWNVFMTGQAILAQDSSDPAAGISHTDSTTAAVQIGADYRFTPHFLVGAMFGYGHTHASLDDIGSSASVDTYSPAIYASYADKGWYGNALASYGWSDYSQSRNVSLPGFGGTATSSPSGSQVVGNLDGGYDFHRGPWTFGPTLGVEYTHLDVDGYSENGLPGADLTVGRSQDDSLRSEVGGRVSYSATGAGVLFTPHLSASWQHEYLDSSRGVTSQFSDVGAGSFTVNTPRPSRDSALIDVGLDAQIDRTWMVFADYGVNAGQSDYFGQSIQAGARMGF